MLPRYGSPNSTRRPWRYYAFEYSAGGMDFGDSTNPGCSSLAVPCSKITEIRPLECSIVLGLCSDQPVTLHLSYAKVSIRPCGPTGLFDSSKLQTISGGVPEWLNGPVSKTGIGGSPYRGFESLLLRHKNKKQTVKPLLSFLIR